jgi:FkbM family methyltransferase
MLQQIILLARNNKVFNGFISFIGLIFLSEHNQNVLRWKLINGDETLRLDYPLDSNSIVFDVGGYKGDFSMRIYRKYKCNIYVFEPIKEYYQIIKKRFRHLKKVHVFYFGLAARTKYIEMHRAKDATSAYGKSTTLEKVKLVNIEEILQKYKIEKVNLIKLNIEGGEYELLESLIKSNVVKRFRDIQVQFHPAVENAQERLDIIQKGLKKTHKLTYRYPFVWENWTLRQSQ